MLPTTHNPLHPSSILYRGWARSLLHAYLDIKSGDEGNLQKLEECWQLVSLQTNWKIEPLLTYKEETEEATVPQSVDVSDNNPHEESDMEEMCPLMKCREIQRNILTLY